MTMINKELVNFLTKTNNINGVSFVGIKGYKNSKGEIANLRINIGAELDKAKAKDLKEFKAMTREQLESKLSDSILKDLPFAIFTKAYINVYNSLVKIGDKDYYGVTKVKNSRSYGQTNAYTVINNSVKIHNENEQLYMYGLLEDKKVLVEGVYPTVKSRLLTIVQNQMKKGMKSQKFRMYIVNMVDVMNVSKASFKGSDLDINLN